MSGSGGGAAGGGSAVASLDLKGSQPPANTFIQHDNMTIVSAAPRAPAAGSGGASAESSSASSGSRRRRRRQRTTAASRQRSKDEQLREPVVARREKHRLLPAYLRVRGLVSQHVESYNHFLNFGMRRILGANSEVRSDVDVDFFIKYLDIYTSAPSVDDYQSGTPTVINPHKCRLRDLTYSCPILVDVKYRRGKDVVIKRGQSIGKLPVMLHSQRCVLSNPAAKMSVEKECPYDPGGYFVIKGQERVILMQEQREFVVGA